MKKAKRKSILLGKNYLVIIAAIFSACEFINEQDNVNGLDGTFQIKSDSTKLVWQFKNGNEFYEQSTYHQCDTSEMKAKFILKDTVLSLSSIQFRDPISTTCPMVFSSWNTLNHLEYQVKKNINGNLMVLRCLRGRCPESTAVWIEYVKQ